MFRKNIAIIASFILATGLCAQENIQEAVDKHTVRDARKALAAFCEKYSKKERAKHEKTIANKRNLLSLLRTDCFVLKPLVHFMQRWLRENKGFWSYVPLISLMESTEFALWHLRDVGSNVHSLRRDFLGRVKEALTIVDCHLDKQQITDQETQEALKVCMGKGYSEKRCARLIGYWKDARKANRKAIKKLLNDWE